MLVGAAAGDRDVGGSSAGCGGEGEGLGVDAAAGGGNDAEGAAAGGDAADGRLLRELGDGGVAGSGGLVAGGTGLAVGMLEVPGEVLAGTTSGAGGASDAADGLLPDVGFAALLPPASWAPAGEANTASRSAPASKSAQGRAGRNWWRRLAAELGQGPADIIARPPAALNESSCPRRPADRRS